MGVKFLHACWSVCKSQSKMRLFAFRGWPPGSVENSHWVKNLSLEITNHIDQYLRPRLHTRFVHGFSAFCRAYVGWLSFYFIILRSKRSKIKNDASVFITSVLEIWKGLSWKNDASWLYIENRFESRKLECRRSFRSTQESDSFVSYLVFDPWLV